MELRVLKYLVSLADRGSFTAAAKDHFITQPAISIQVKKLQEELGVTLVEVEGRTVRFTDTGKTVLEYARRFADLERQLLTEIRDLEGLQKGSLALGTIDAASIYVLPGVFSRFNEIYPGIDVDLEISSTVPLLRSLEEGDLDLVVGTLPVDSGAPFDVFQVYSESLVPIAPPDHPLAAGGPVDAKRLSGYPFISFHRGSVTRRIIEDALVEKGIELRITMAIDSQEAIRNLVASGFGLAILPEWTVREQVRSGSIAELKVKGLKIERNLGLIVPSDRYLSMTARAFLGILRDGLGIALPDRLCIPERGSG